MEESHKTHRPHIKVGKDEEKKKKKTGNGMDYEHQRLYRNEIRRSCEIG